MEIKLSDQFYISDHRVRKIDITVIIIDSLQRLSFATF